MKKNKRGWIRIAEAVASILLIAGVVLIAIRYSQVGSQDISSKVYLSESGTLRNIELNDTVRNEIVNVPVSSLPVNWTGSSSFDTLAQSTKAEINMSTPSYIECWGRICDTNDTCYLEKTPKKTVYAQSVLISSNLQTYSPKLLKVFCWQP